MSENPNRIQGKLSESQRRELDRHIDTLHADIHEKSVLRSAHRIIWASYRIQRLYNTVFSKPGSPVRKSSDSSTPPALAEFLLTLLIPKRCAKALLGDLQQTFHENCKNGTVRRAQLLHWAETMRSIAPLLWSASAKIGLIGAAAALARKLIG